MNTDAGALEELDREECLQLLASFSVGRIAVATAHASPFVVPVSGAPGSTRGGGPAPYPDRRQNWK